MMKPVASYPTVFYSLFDEVNFCLKFFCSRHLTLNYGKKKFNDVRQSLWKNLQ